MNLEDIKVWLVDADHKARPKNPYLVEQRGGFSIINAGNANVYTDFETFATQHTYHCSPSLVGEYPAADVELVWQYRANVNQYWKTVDGAYPFDNYEEFERDYSFHGWECRQYLQLKQPGQEQEIPKEITERKTDLGLSNNIEPCPFCGGTEGEQVFLGRTEPDHYQISCICCSVKMKHDRKDKVIGIWNNRKPLSDFN